LPLTTTTTTTDADDSSSSKPATSSSTEEGGKPHSGLSSQECLNQCKDYARNATREATTTTCTKDLYPIPLDRQLCRQGFLSQQYAAVSECLSTTCYY